MSEKDEQTTRKAIIEASMELFAKRGYHGTSVSQIAAATGLTKGALYWHFEGKEDLFLTVLSCIRESWQESIMSRVESSVRVVEKLERLQGHKDSEALARKIYTLPYRQLFLIRSKS